MKAVGWGGVLRKLISLVGLLFGIALLVGFPTADANSRNCTTEERAAADNALWLNQSDKKRAVGRHLPWGMPQPPVPNASEETLVQRDYIIGYDRDLLVPLWTAHRLERSGLGKVDRVNCFRRDPRINAPFASLPSDYIEPNYDQGHLTPNGDMSKGLIPVVNSFVMSNMAPQYCQFNRGVWQILESLVRLWVMERGIVYVITGSIFDRDVDGKRDPAFAAKRMKSNNGKARVAIPTHFYKMVAHQRADGTVETLTVVLPHDQTDVTGAEAVRRLEQHIRSVGELETVTGLTFFPDAGANAAIGKQARSSELWPFKGKPPRSLVDDRCRSTVGANG